MINKPKEQSPGVFQEILISQFLSSCPRKSSAIGRHADHVSLLMLQKAQSRQKASLCRRGAWGGAWGMQWAVRLELGFEL